MLLSSIQKCSKCDISFAWEYTTPETERVLNFEGETSSIASAKLVSAKEGKYDIKVKCPKCKALNKFYIIVSRCNNEK